VSGYRYQVDMRDPATGQWTPDGPQASGVTRTGEAPQEAAGRLLRNWTADAGSAAGLGFRARLWTYSATFDGPHGDLAGEAVTAPRRTRRDAR
jgi:hypothetical protein